MYVNVNINFNNAICQISIYGIKSTDVSSTHKSQCIWNLLVYYAKYKMLVSILPDTGGWLIVVNYRVNA